MSTLAIVPARAGSKRLPRKNVRLLKGKPLVAWAIEAGLAARCVDRLCVSSDDPEVMEIAARYASVEQLVRPAALASDTAPALGYVRHALEAFPDTDTVVILQPTSPLTQPADIDGTVALLRSSGADSAVSVMELDHAIHPLKLKVLDGDRLRPFLEEERGRMMAHELPTLFVRNCAVYAMPVTTIERGDLLGVDSRGYVMPRSRSIDINDEVDFKLAELLAAALDS